MVKITEFKIAIFVLSILVISSMFVMGAHLVATNTTTILEDTSTLINISINNTDAALTANITGVKIIIPSSFVVFNDTANTSVSSVANFSYTSEGLNWTGEGLIRNLTNNIYFWFNISQVTPGSYNISVNTTNSSSTRTFNISIVVNDTTVPSDVSFASNSDIDGSNISRGNIVINISAVDNGLIDRIIIRVYNSTKGLINTTVSSAVGASTGSLFVNFTGMNNSYYYVNATVNDSFGNRALSSNATIIVDKINPLVTLLSPSDVYTSSSSPVGFVFNVTDANPTSCTVLINGVSYQTNSSVNVAGAGNTISVGVDNGEYNWAVNCTDIAGNNNVTSALSIIYAVSSGNTGHGTSGGGSVVSQWVKEIKVEGSDLNLGQTLKEMKKNYRATFNVKGVGHSVGIKDITATTVTIEVASTPQTATMKVGETRNFDVDGDGVYDISVTVSSISAGQANLVLNPISAPVSTTPATGNAVAPTNEETTNNAAPSTPSAEPKSESSSSLVWVWILVAVLVVVVVVWAVRRRN